jgi:hypothetical protein
VTQINHRHAPPLNHAHHRFVVEPGDDAVAAPSFEPFGNVIAQTVFLEKNGPLGVLPDVIRHARQGAAAVSPRGLHQQRNPRTFGRNQFFHITIHENYYP